MSADTPAVRRLIQSLTEKVIFSQSSQLHSQSHSSATNCHSTLSSSHTQQQQQLLISEKPLTGKEITMIFQGTNNYFLYL